MPYRATLPVRSKRGAVQSQPSVSCCRIGNSSREPYRYLPPSHQAHVRKLYSVSPDTVDVSWTTGKTIVVQCAGKAFLHPILSDTDDDAPEFTCLEEDP